MRLKIGIFVLAVLTMLSGCLVDKPDTTPVRAATAEEAIHSMFTALKTADAPTFHSLVQYKQYKENGIVIETERFFGSTLDNDGKAYMLAVFEGLVYKIISSEEGAEKQKSFTIEITNKDLSKVHTFDYLGADNILLAQAEGIKEITQTTTQMVEVTVIYTEKGWQVEIDEPLRNALWGNKQGALDTLSYFIP